MNAAKPQRLESESYFPSDQKLPLHDALRGFVDNCRRLEEIHERRGKRLLIAAALLAGLAAPAVGISGWALSRHAIQPAATAEIQGRSDPSAVGGSATTARPDPASPEKSPEKSQTNPLLLVLGLASVFLVGAIAVLVGWGRRELGSAWAYSLRSGQHIDVWISQRIAGDGHQSAVDFAAAAKGVASQRRNFMGSILEKSVMELPGVAKNGDAN